MLETKCIKGTIRLVNLQSTIRSVNSRKESNYLRKYMLSKNLLAKIIAKRSLTLIISIFFGLLISAQWYSLPARVSNPVSPYLSLKETRDELTTEQSELKNEISRLQSEIKTIEQNSENISLTKNEISLLNAKKSRAGLTKLNGPGVIIVLDDSKQDAVSEDSIIHASDLRDLINILWAKGAEGVSVNDQRIVINSAIDCIVNTIMVNNVKISNPFRIEAVGNQELMYNSLTNNSSLSALHTRKKDNGILFEVSNNNDITLPIFNGSFDTKVVSSEENV